MKRLTRADQQRRTHHRLLEVGMAVFLRRGYLATTVEEIAAEAGYTRGAVYKHFGGKEGLWSAIVDSRVDVHLSRLRAALGAVTSREELVAVLASGTGADDDDAMRWAVVSTGFMAATAGRPELARPIVAAQREREQEIVGELTAVCDRLGVCPAMPLARIVIALPALGGSLALRAGIDPEVETSAVVTSIVDLLFPA